MGLIVFLTACAHVISQESLKKVDPDLTFQILIKHPDRYQRKQILAGGRILSTEVREGETWVKVLQHPLDWKQKPKNTDESYGRFFIRFRGFLDPAIYTSGKRITVLGEVQGRKVKRLSDMEYSYPVLLSLEHHLWKPENLGGPSFHFGIGIGGVIR